MKQKATKPVIRFEGFTDDWEQRKLKDISKVTYGGGTPKTSKEEYWSGDVPWIQSSDLILDSFTEVIPTKFITNDAVQKSAAKIIPEDSLAIVTRVGVGKLALIPYKYATSQDFLSLSELKIDKYYSLYVVHKLLQIEKHKLQGTSIKGITKSELLNKLIMVPKDNIEQQKIGTFFKQLDETIALHQRQLEALEKTKKSFLQKMFPKKDETIPEIRFAGFTDDWEQRKLGEVFNERTERSPEGELISVTINQGVVKASSLDRKDNSSSNKSNYKVVKKGDIAYNSMRMWQGASGYSPYSGILSPAYTVICPKSNIDSIFMSYMFKKHDMIQIFKRNSQGLTSDTWNLKFPALSSIKVKIPILDEQNKISRFFKQLDDTIALHQRQLEALEMTKKSFLQKMFI